MSRMSYSQKEDLIRSLTNSMGMSYEPDTRYGSSKFDSSTGTLYCEGMVLPHSSLEHILDFYKKQMDSLKVVAMRDKNMTESYMRAAVAYNAILLLNERENI